MRHNHIVVKYVINNKDDGNVTFALICCVIRITLPLISGQQHFAFCLSTHLVHAVAVIPKTGYYETRVSRVSDCSGCYRIHENIKVQKLAYSL